MLLLSVEAILIFRTSIGMTLDVVSRYMPYVEADHHKIHRYFQSKTTSEILYYTKYFGQSAGGTVFKWKLICDMSFCSSTHMYKSPEEMLVHSYSM